jgi:hypothetical protein
MCLAAYVAKKSFADRHICDMVKSCLFFNIVFKTHSTTLQQLQKMIILTLLHTYNGNPLLIGFFCKFFNDLYKKMSFEAIFIFKVDPYNLLMCGFWALKTISFVAH